MKMTDSVVVEGYVKFRDGKKWKNRWVVLRKPSPVADCLVLLVFKDKSDKAQGHRERGSITLEDICGLETSLSCDGVGYTLSIICLSQAAVLGFERKEALLAWDIRIRYSLGEVHRFSVGILPGTKLESGPATLHLCNSLLVLARDLPPVVIGQWKLPDLRRYGPVPNGFVFEGGTRCGYWAGVFFLSSAEGEQISFLFDCIVRGISPSKGPFGLQPVFPDLNALASQANAEERMNQEAEELEKRLSMLSHQSNTASSSYIISVAGDDRSISGSSDTSSQSDSSVGSRLAIWTEPVTTSSPPADTIIGQSGPKVALPAEEKLPANQVGGARTVAKPPRSRQLQEIGRQSSSDSGIATGSHSSYSGSFSSYSGSLDNTTGGGDFGSLLSLPPHLALDLPLCSCPPATGHEYQVPTSLRYLYDSPRLLLQGGAEGNSGQETSTTAKDRAAGSTVSPPTCESTLGVTKVPHWVCSDAVERSSTENLQGNFEESKSRVVLPGDSQHPDSSQICRTSQTIASKTLLTICPTCGGFKGNTLLYTGGLGMPAIPGKHIDRCPCRPNCSFFEYVKVDSLKKTRVTTPSLASLTNHSTEKLRRIDEEQADTKKKDKGKLAKLLADLLGYHGTNGEPGSEANRPSLYESMTTAFGQELRTQQPVTAAGTLRCLISNPERSTVIYENCLKCKKGADCHSLPRVTPTLCSDAVVLHVDQTSQSRVCSGQTTPSWPCLENGVYCKGTSQKEQPIDVTQLDQDIDLPHVEVKDKKQRSNDRRRTVDYEVMESRMLEKSSEPEARSKYELMGNCGQQQFLPETEGTMFAFPPDLSVPERLRGDGVTYVNIPISPTSKKQLNYMEVEHQELSAVRVTGQHLPGQRKGFTKYAQIDITATDAAHRTGAQHALGREEGLHTLEQRRRGQPQ
ncbi:hypothetical protein UPYG_G00241030 [Umbra pygmaea]|uniref:Docking protein 7 n=1 Tax=Umbra pygmaea TaxID=75934 RepID=A0ABD0WFG4_UMBPY